MISEKLADIRKKIDDICRKTRRNPDDVVLVAVTKYTTLEKMQEAIRAGVTHVGENKVKDADGRFVELGDVAQEVTKHMIGHLQTNKVKKVLQIFDMIQSVDSEKLLLEIEKQAAKLNRNIDVLIEVNLSKEEQKFGIAADGAIALAEKAANCPHINLLGLMTMAPFTSDTEIIRKCFSDCRNLKNRIAERFSGKDNIDMKYLSMGMTNDYEIALEEGANMIRIGTAIFGD